MIDIRQSKNYAKYLQSEGWIVERVNNINYFIKKIPLLGSVLKIQRPNNIDFQKIHDLERKYNVFQTVIEPTSASVINTFSDIHNLLLTNKFKLSKSPFLPSKSLQIDLTQAIAAITAGFDKDTRRALRRGEGIATKELTSASDIKNFYNAWKSSVNFTRHVPSLTNLINFKKSFPQSNSLFLASYNNIGRIIGGAIFTRSYKDFSYYWYGFTSNEGRSSLSQHSLLYRGILWGKSQGCKVFDFEGIYDERFPLPSWQGFSQFKRSFGGKEVTYPGCFVKYRFPYLDR
jgi:hypothetical protein